VVTYYVVKDFVRGLDARKMLETTEPGALIAGTNCHITNGGEVDKRHAFVLSSVLPAGTHGLWLNEDNSFIVFGSGPQSPFLPINAQYIRCQHPDGVTPMHRVLSQDSFFGKPYIVAEFNDGTVHHFWNGEYIREQGVPPDFVVPASPPSTPPPPTPVGTGRATATVTFAMDEGATTAQIYGLWVFSPQVWESQDYDEILAIAPGISFPLEVTPATVATQVAALAAEINDAALTPKLNARANGNQLTVSFDTRGALYNSWILSVSAIGLTIDGTNGWATFSGGEDTPAPATPEGVPDDGVEPAEEFRWSPGRFATTHRQKMYATSGPLVHFTAIDNCRIYSPDATGAGFIDVSTHAKGSQDLVSMGEFQERLALFSRKQIQLWAMDPDPRQNQIIQVIHNTGTFAPRSVVEYGTGDLFYLDRSGIRSLQARALNNTAVMTDVGSLIDRLVIETLAGLSEDQRQRASAIIEPNSGRLWVCIGSRIYVLSLFPTSRISAWTVYEPGFQVDYIDASSSRVAIRNGDNLYIYGGESGTEDADDYSVTTQIPFLDMQKPGTTKILEGIDAALEGTWTVTAYLDPTRPTAGAKVGTLDRTTYGLARIGLQGHATHVSLKFVHRGAGRARIGSLTIHYQEAGSG
jgi:hypothetical protein